MCILGAEAAEPQFQITLAIDIDSIAPGSEARAAFEVDFVRDMAAALGVDESLIQIIEIIAGSVAVTFEVAATDDVDVASVLSTTRPTIAGAEFEFVAAVSYSVDTPPPPASGGSIESAAAENRAVAAMSGGALAVPSAARAFVALAIGAVLVLNL